VAWIRTLLFFCLFASLGCASAAPPAPVASDAPASLPPEASAFTEADALFHGDGRWVGADSAYSVDLGRGRVLWLFADTFVDPAADGVRGNGPTWLARNSVAIQHARAGAPPETGYDPTRAELDFAWRSAPDGAARSFFADVDEPGHWLWPLHGVRLPTGPLLLFRMHVRKVEGGLGFALSGWDAVAIDDPDAPPDAWQPRLVQPETNTPALLLGAALLVHDGALYAYAARNDDRAHAIYLARFALSELGTPPGGLPEGALADPEWHCGARGFVRQSAGAAPVALFEDGQTELSVHFDARRDRFVEVQLRGLFLSEPTTALGLRTAPHPEGPWSALAPFYRPPEAERPDVTQLVAYAGKAHPEQRAPDDALVVSYVAHHLGAPVPPDALYWPRLVRMP
jgi:hypothetical protein